MKISVFMKGRMNSYDALGIFDGKGITVLKGSRISEKVAVKINPIVIKKRNDSNIVSKDFVVLQDVYFRSSSTAAAFVSGNISNGLRVWKVAPGKDLGKFKEEKNG